MSDKFITGQLATQSWMVAPETLRVMAALSAKGEARFVGGAVRDALLNRPVMDVDIATTLFPDETIETLIEHNISYVPSGLQHGTVTAIIDGTSFEITTLRRDVKSHGRTSDVAFTQDWQKDAQRRDFTINALYATIDGKIYDYFGGVQDLRAGRVIFVGDPAERIREDHLRILRYFRFHAHYGRGEADTRSMAAAIDLAHLIQTLSRERIRQEVLKLLAADRAGEIWRIMAENGVVTHFLPEATRISALEKTIALEQRLHRGGYALRRLASLLDATPEGLRRLSEHLRLSRDQARLLAAIVLTAPSLMKNADARHIKRLVYRYGNELVESMVIVAAAWGADFDIDALHDVAAVFRSPRFPLTGDDLTARGLQPGPRLGEILKEIENWWIAEDFVPGRTAVLQELDRRLAKK